jgi:heat shock protein HtpX
MIVNALPIDYIPSITGIFCLIGLVMCIAWIVFSVSVGSQLAWRILRVVELGPEDYPGLQASIVELAKTIGVVRPRIGLVEDLRPNAFICGRNKRPMIVFSLGLIRMLDDDELRAVAAHELVHIKHRDTQFRTVASALAWLSFFNPLAFVAMRMARRERERMADDAASAVLGDKAALVEVIKKVSSALANPGSKPLRGSGLGFLLVSSLSERISLLSTHPSVTDRVRNIKKGSRKRPTASSLAVCLVLSLLVIVAAGSLTISLGQLREEMIKGNLDLMRIAPEDIGFHLNVPPRDIVRADQAPHDLDFASPSPSNPHNFLGSRLISAVVPMHRY